MDKNNITYPSVSIVIPMYNEVGYIGKLIESIQDQKYPKDKIEILVVDGRSTDGSKELVEGMAENNKDIILLDNPRRSTSSALNIGVNNSSGDIIIIIGAHSTIHHDFVQNNVTTMDKQTVLCTGGRIINKGNTFIQRLIGTAMSTPFGMGSAPYRYSKKVKFVDTVMYGAYKRSLFDDIGLFEENIMISEDAEFNWRIRQAGYQIVFDPSIISYYYPRESLRGLIKQFFRYGMLRVNVLKKHRNGINHYHLLPPLFIALLTILIIGGMVLPSMFHAAVILLLIHSIAGFMSGVIYIKEKFILSVIIMPIIYMSMHFSWGIGFIYGLLKRDKNVV